MRGNPITAGSSLAENGSYLDAIQQFQTSLKISIRSSSTARYNLGVTFQKLKSYEKALAEFKSGRETRGRTKRNTISVLAIPTFISNATMMRRTHSKNVVEAQPGSIRKAQYSLAVCYEKMDAERQGKTRLATLSRDRQGQRMGGRGAAASEQSRITWNTQTRIPRDTRSDDLLND